MSRDWATVIGGMTLEEKASLTAGSICGTSPASSGSGSRRSGSPTGRTAPVARVCSAPASVTAACLPCGSALGATWDPELIERGRVDARARRPAPRPAASCWRRRVNLHRSPLGGRNFECYSEDPLLVRQDRRCVRARRPVPGRRRPRKHFVGNDAEFERNTMSSEIDERALRELYLRPFELAVSEGGALGVMTAYNRLNGPHCTEDAELLDDILRGEWGFDGFVITDWFARGSHRRLAAARARPRDARPGALLRAGAGRRRARGRVPEAHARRDRPRAAERLRPARRARRPPRRAPSGRRSAGASRARARAAATAMVLLGNDGMLPLDRAGDPLARRDRPERATAADHGRRIGAARARTTGSRRSTPSARALGDASRPSSRAATSTSPTPMPRPHWRHRTAPGFESSFADGHTRGRTGGDRRSGPATLLPGRRARARRRHATSRCGPPPLHARAQRAATFTLVRARTCPVVLSTARSSSTESPTRRPRGGDAFGIGEHRGADGAHRAHRRASRSSWWSSTRPRDSLFLLPALEVGQPAPTARPIDARRRPRRADADAAVVLVGTNDDWESEGHDRDLDGPPRRAGRARRDGCSRRTRHDRRRQRRLAGDDAVGRRRRRRRAGLVRRPGDGERARRRALRRRRTGRSAADDDPAAHRAQPLVGNFPGENGQLRYGEGVFVGYRWYDAGTCRSASRSATASRTRRSTFGEPTRRADFRRAAPSPSSVPVTNTGDRRGAEVVQCYVRPPQPVASSRPPGAPAFAEGVARAGRDDDRHDRPRRAGVRLLGPGRSRTDDATPGWRVDPGTYTLHVGRSSADITQCPHGRTLTVRRVILREFGPYSNLEFEELARPKPGPGQAVVAIEAAGVGYCRHPVRARHVPAAPGAPVGARVRAGRSRGEVGDDVARFAVGDRVLATSFAGSFQTHTVLREEELVPIPGDLSAGQAAGLVASYGTMLLDPPHHGRTGRSGWSSSAPAAESASPPPTSPRRWPRNVIACASTPAKRALAEHAGADVTLDYSDPELDLKATVRELTDGGAGLVVDPVGEPRRRRVAPSRSVLRGPLPGRWGSPAATSQRSRSTRCCSTIAP